MRRSEEQVKRRMSSAVDLVIAKHNNPDLPTEVLLKRVNLGPYHFYNQVLNRNRLLEAASGTKFKTLDSILSDDEARTRLFRMSFDFLTGQYTQVQNRKADKYIEGTFENNENIENLIYIAFTTNNPRLNSDRITVVDEFIKLKPKIEDYIKTNGIKRIFDTHKKRAGSLAPSIMELFDNARKRIREDDSIFDLSKSSHLHLWEFWLGTRTSYWGDPKRAAAAVYHIMTTKNPKLKYKSRETVIEQLKSLPPELDDYFNRLNLRALIKKGFNGQFARFNIAVLYAFDEGYKSATGNKSIFDLNERYHLHPWGTNSKLHLDIGTIQIRKKKQYTM